MTRKISALLIMESTSQSPELGRKKGGRYCVAGFPNGDSCKNGQFTKGVSLHEFPNAEKDHARFMKWMRFVKRHRPNWAYTKSAVLCSEHFEDLSFVRNRSIAAELGLKILLNPDAVPTVDKLHAETEKDVACEPSTRVRPSTRDLRMVSTTLIIICQYLANQSF